MKKFLIATASVYAAWFMINFVFNVVILMDDYRSTPQLWRAEGEMKFWVFQLSSVIAAVCFTTIYISLVRDKSFIKALGYGILTGISFGVTAGLGTYSFTPVSEHVATMWFLNGLSTGTVGGFLLGLTTRE